MRRGPCCQTLIESTLFLSNCLVFFISCLILIGLGFFLTNANDWIFSTNIIPVQYYEGLLQVLIDLHGAINLLPVLVIVTVCMCSILISFIGCIGTCLHNKCFVIIYFLFMITFLLSLLGAIAASFSVNSKLGLEIVLNKTLTMYNVNYPVQSMWDVMQFRLECCGINSYADWKGLTAGNISEPDCFLPFSCNKNFSLNISNMSETSSTAPRMICIDKEMDLVYEEGCLSTLYKIVSDEQVVYLMWIITASLGALLIVHVIFSLSLCVVIDYKEFFYKY